MKIYTKSGDKGKTSLFNGQRVYKNNIRVETYGTVDELNSTLGICISYSTNDKIKEQLQQVQNDLFDIGGTLANPSSKPTSTLVNHWIDRTTELEKFIDQCSSKLPELTNFILPGGSHAGSFLHLARTVCRRAERTIITLAQKEEVQKEIIIYLNRLSDLLFMISRYVNHLEKKDEITWKRTE